MVFDDLRSPFLLVSKRIHRNLFPEIMAIFLNWFPLAFSKPVQELPTRTFESWDELKTFVNSRQWAKSGYVASGRRGNDQSGVQLTLVEDLSSTTSELQMSSFDLGENIKLGSRIAEISLLRHLSSFGFDVRGANSNHMRRRKNSESRRWASALRPAFLSNRTSCNTARHTV